MISCEACSKVPACAFVLCVARNQALDRSSKGKQAAAAKTRFTRNVLYLIRAMLASHHISNQVL
jgi:hypothetical protein